MVKFKNKIILVFFSCCAFVLAFLGVRFFDTNQFLSANADFVVDEANPYNNDYAESLYLADNIFPYFYIYDNMKSGDLNVTVNSDGSINYSGRVEKVTLQYLYYYDIESSDYTFLPFGIFDTYRFAFFLDGISYDSLSIVHFKISGTNTAVPINRTGSVPYYELSLNSNSKGFSIFFTLMPGEYDFTVYPSVSTLVPVVYKTSVFFYYDTLKYHSQNNTGLNYDKGYEDGYNQAVQDKDLGYGPLVASTVTYRLYEVKDSFGNATSNVEIYTTSFSSLYKDGEKVYFYFDGLREQLESLAPFGWGYTTLTFTFTEEYLVSSLGLGFDTTFLYTLFRFNVVNGYGVLTSNTNTQALPAPYMLTFSTSEITDRTNFITINYSPRGVPSDTEWVFGSSCLVVTSGMYSLGYNEGFVFGEEAGYKQGYFDAEKDVAPKIEAAQKEGFANGKAQGFAEGVAAAEDNDFVSAISSVVGAPVIVVKEFLNFEILGINMLAFFSGIITLLIIIRCIKFIF